MKDALKTADENQRAAANPGASVFVTANAGSGKTKVLVDRIARLLLSGARPSAFLCITYTKAAAAEMQRRLFERLGAWCVADDAKLKAELSKLGADPADLARARALFARALETPGGLRIQTIHAFCERLLARFPLEAGVAPGFDIVDEARAAALLERARAECVLGPRAPLAAHRRFAERLGADGVDGLMNRLVARRADLRRLALGAAGAPRARHGVVESAAEYAARAVAGLDWEALRHAAKALGESSPNDQKTASRLARALALRDTEAPAEEIVAALAAVALKKDGEPYGTLATQALLKKNAWLGAVLSAVAALAEQAREKLNAIARAEDAEAALALAAALDGAYDAAKTRAGGLDFEDLIVHAQALLSRAEAAPWVLYKLDGGFDHILIDEGQDTSPAQWELIAPLQDEFFAGAGARETPRTMFAVGDPKQSIYAFQGADPERFLREAQALASRAHMAGQTFVAPVLETSFRSAPEILRAVDAVFGAKSLAAMPPGELDEVRHLASRASEDGVVEVWPLARRPVAAEASAWDAPLDVETGASVHALLARDIARRVKAMIEAREAIWEKGARRPMRPGGVLALVRTRGALFRELIKAFKRAGLPVAGADRMVLRDELAVEDCLALMRAALDPGDDLALACVLKGPWLGLDDDDRDLFPLAFGREKGETLHQRLLANTEAKYERARDFVARLEARAGDDPFSFLCWALETPHGGGPTGWALILQRLGQECRDPLEELLQRAVKLAAHRAATLQRFLHDIEMDVGQVKREMDSAADAVRVMTVHGAKGLEAPVVILPDCTAPVSDKLDEGLLIDAESGLFISPRERDDDAATRAARAAHKRRALAEHWRLFYVAMTRARDRLIICGAQHGNGGDGEAEMSWRRAGEEALRALGGEPCETPYGEGLRLGAPTLAAGAAEDVVATLPLPEWARTPAPGARRSDALAPSRLNRVEPGLISPRGDGQKRFRRGRLIHGLLQRLPDVAPQDRAEAALVWLKRQGVSAAEGAKLASEALAVVADTSFAPLFATNSRAETPIIGEVLGKPVRGVVDRLAISHEGVLILDFKTDRPAPASADLTPDAYVLQMALYREVMRKIFPNSPVRCALVWTETPLLLELPPARLDTVFDAFARG